MTSIFARALGSEFDRLHPEIQARFGRETLTFVRTFTLPETRRRFDATMIYSERRKCVIDYLGTHRHLAAEVALSVDEGGGLRLRTGVQRFYLGRYLGFEFPLIFSGCGDVHEWWDAEAGRHRIEVVVGNPRFGRLFGYRGSFTAVRRAVPPEGVPPSVQPIREQRRE